MGRGRVVRVEDCWWCLEGLGAEGWGLRQDQWTKWVWFQDRLSPTFRHRKPLEMFWRQLTLASYRQFSSLGQADVLQVSLLSFSLSLWKWWSGKRNVCIASCSIPVLYSSLCGSDTHPQWAAIVYCMLTLYRRGPGRVKGWRDQAAVEAANSGKEGWNPGSH